MKASNEQLKYDVTRFPVRAILSIWGCCGKNLEVLAGVQHRTGADCWAEGFCCVEYVRIVPQYRPGPRPAGLHEANSPRIF